jgi:hypothetical protein
MAEVRIREASPLTVSVVVGNKVVASMTIPEAQSEAEAAGTVYWVRLEEAAHPWKARVRENPQGAELLQESGTTAQ